MCQIFCTSRTGATAWALSNLDGADGASEFAAQVVGIPAMIASVSMVAAAPLIDWDLGLIEGVEVFALEKPLA